jgi:hypothetical protein
MVETTLELAKGTNGAAERRKILGSSTGGRARSM